MMRMQAQYKSIVSRDRWLGLTVLLKAICLSFWMQATPSECHSWLGTEMWIPFKEFSNALHSPPQNVLLNCESWRVSKAFLVAQPAVIMLRGSTTKQATQVQELDQKSC